MKFNPLVIIVTFTGLYLLVRLRFFFIIHPIRTVKNMLRGLCRRDTLRSLFLALSGTLGVGNVVGVALGIIIGGAGSVFWMLVSTLFAAVIKYAEVTLASDGVCRNKDGTHGGMHYALLRFFGRLGPILATVYSVAMILLSLFMGASLQSAALVGSIGLIFDTPPIIIGILLAFAVLFAVVFGTSIIERITSFIIPVTTIVYIILCFSIIVFCRDRIPLALGEIIRGAFGSRGMLGGAVGFFFSRALSEGFSRGLLSNEAGTGTSSVAHARGGSLHPSMRGLMGIVEVVFDTSVLCTLTALAILTAVPDALDFSSGVTLVLAATRPLGRIATVTLSLCITAFAFSTVVCWYFYSAEAQLALFGRTSFFFLPVYLGFILLGACIPERPMLLVTDTLLLVMTAITSLALIKKSDRICTLSEGFGLYGSPCKKFKCIGFHRRAGGKTVR